MNFTELLPNNRVFRLLCHSLLHIPLLVLCNWRIPYCIFPTVARQISSPSYQKEKSGSGSVPVGSASSPAIQRQRHFLEPGVNEVSDTYTRSIKELLCRFHLLPLSQQGDLDAAPRQHPRCGISAFFQHFVAVTFAAHSPMLWIPEPALSLDFTAETGGEGRLGSVANDAFTLHGFGRCIAIVSYGISELVGRQGSLTSEKKVCGGRCAAFQCLQGLCVRLHTSSVTAHSTLDPVIRRELARLVFSEVKSLSSRRSRVRRNYWWTGASM